jgi:Leucine-rich repeat (LRR) protein
MSPFFNDLPVEVVDVISKFLYDPIDVRNTLFVKGISDSVSRVCKVTCVKSISVPTGFERVSIDLSDWNRHLHDNPFKNLYDLKYLRIKMHIHSHALFGSSMFRHLFESNLPSLVYLNISNIPTPLAGIDISGFSSASSLKTLIMSECRVRDLSGIQSLRALTSLDLSYNKVTDDQVKIHLVNMTRLVSLNLRSNYKVTPCCFEHLPRTLTYLNISFCTSSGCTLIDESGFKKLPTTITCLVADSCDEMYIGDMTHMTSLTSLSLLYNDFDVHVLFRNLPPSLERKSIKM